MSHDDRTPWHFPFTADAVHKAAWIMWTENDPSKATVAMWMGDDAIDDGANSGANPGDSK